MTLPPIIPRGGSKWAPCFGGPKTVRVSAADVTVLDNATLHPDGTVTQDDPAPPHEDATVLALAAGEGVSLGRFMTGALTLFDRQPADTICCGAPLTTLQADAMRKLNLFSRYRVVTAATSFRRLFCAASADVPGPHIRGVADRLRSPVGMAGAPIAILPSRETERFSLANRASLSVWFRAKKVALVDPESTALGDLSDRLASASLVILADPEQAGLLGLCSPGAVILEIAPEGWLGAAARCVAAIFGLRYVPFLASAPSYPLRGAIPFGARVALSYEVPIRALARTLDALGEVRVVI